MRFCKLDRCRISCVPRRQTKQGKTNRARRMTGRNLNMERETRLGPWCNSGISVSIKNQEQWVSGKMHTDPGKPAYSEIPRANYRLTEWKTGSSAKVEGTTLYIAVSLDRGGGQPPTPGTPPIARVSSTLFGRQSALRLCLLGPRSGNWPDGVFVG
jgi:hypothetical protein